MNPEKREFLRNFVGMYDIKTAADLQDAVKDLLGDTMATRSINIQTTPTAVTDTNQRKS